MLRGTIEMRHMQTVYGEVAKKESDSATHQHVEPRTQSKRNRAQVKGHSHHYVRKIHNTSTTLVPRNREFIHKHVRAKSCTHEEQHPFTPLTLASFIHSHSQTDYLYSTPKTYTQHSTHQVTKSKSKSSQVTSYSIQCCNTSFAYPTSHS
jgi:hypothetical protein